MINRVIQMLLCFQITNSLHMFQPTQATKLSEEINLKVRIQFFVQCTYSFS